MDGWYKYYGTAANRRSEPSRQIERLKKKPTIVVGTPGRLNELAEQIN